MGLIALKAIFTGRLFFIGYLNSKPMKINKSKWKERLYTFYGFAVIVLAFIAGAFVLGVASKIFWNIFKVGWGLL